MRRIGWMVFASFLVACGSPSGRVGGDWTSDGLPSGSSGGSPGVPNGSGETGGSGAGSAGSSTAGTAASGGSVGASASAGGSTSDGAGAGAVVADLPCDVAQVLSAHCWACHGNPPIGGAPRSLVSVADLASPSISSPSQSELALAIQRMQGSAQPIMPPSPLPPASAAEVAVLSNWLAAGMPPSTCGADGGIVSGPDAAPNPYATPVTCTSGTHWTRGDDGSRSMRPGGPCVSCHQQSGGEAPPLFIGGTVYPTAHEPDDCNGAGSSGAGAATVVITGADGTPLTLSVNSVGNFYTEQRVALPFTAKVVVGNSIRAMATPQTSGDCNSCHTESGANDAPGRIMLP